jgi:hypothetical protein
MYPDAYEPGCQDQDFNTHFSEERTRKPIALCFRTLDLYLWAIARSFLFNFRLAG